MSETRTDLVKRAEGAEKRCESLQISTKELTQKLRDTEGRFQKVKATPGTADSKLTRIVVAVALFTLNAVPAFVPRNIFDNRTDSIDRKRRGLETELTKMYSSNQPIKNQPWTKYRHRYNPPLEIAPSFQQNPWTMDY